MKVEVTEEDIRLGCRMQTLDCPIARAVSRATDMIACVCNTRVFLFGPDDVPRDAQGYWANDWKSHAVKQLPLPVDIVRKIVQFDVRGMMEPFEFEI